MKTASGGGNWTSTQPLKLHSLLPLCAPAHESSGFDHLSAGACLCGTAVIYKNLYVRFEFKHICCRCHLPVSTPHGQDVTLDVQLNNNVSGFERPAVTTSIKQCV